PRAARRPCAAAKGDRGDPARRPFDRPRPRRAAANRHARRAAPAPTELQPAVASRRRGDPHPETGVLLTRSRAAASPRDVPRSGTWILFSAKNPLCARHAPAVRAVAAGTKAAFRSEMLPARWTTALGALLVACSSAPRTDGPDYQLAS